MTAYEGAYGAKIEVEDQKNIGDAPPCFLSMQGRMIEYVPEKSLKVAFPVLESYLNPAGSMQGGFITAAFDNVFGPLSHAVMKSLTATIDIHTSYHRPIFAGDELVIKATVTSAGKTVVHMHAEALNAENRLIASATTDYVYLKR
ncbi:MAG: PaaI family thioesterase [Bacillota bacterium]|nr:PaaI family thioesterase [Bacillota bacterium]